MILSENDIHDCITYGDMFVDEVCEELLRWRRVVKKMISVADKIPLSQVTDKMLQDHLEEMEKICQPH